jgi:hypothetical protein
MMNAWNRLPVLLKLLVFIVVVVSASAVVWPMMVRMPGESYQGPLPPATENLRALEQELHTYVQTLAGDIGERNLFHYDKLVTAAEYIRSTLHDFGYEVQRQTYEVKGRVCENIEAEVLGTDRPDHILVIGAHYDSVEGSPGANDNGTGVAAMMALARVFVQTPSKRTVRFVAFVNEEPPFFQTDDMGSRVYAKRSRQRGESIDLMISLETIGYFSDTPGSQSYVPPLNFLYPSTGNFIAFVSNTDNDLWVETVTDLFRRQVPFPSEGAALWGWIPGVGWSDHWAFWKEGFPAVMVTDTAPFRYPYYHTADDTPDKVNYEHLARVVSGLREVIAAIANQQDLASP